MQTTINGEVHYMSYLVLFVINGPLNFNNLGTKI